MEQPTKEELEKWSVGRLLDTPTTRGWSESARSGGQREESRRVFMFFSEEDQGRSRVHLADCSSPRKAQELVQLHNKLIDAYLALEVAIQAEREEHKSLCDGKDNIIIGLVKERQTLEAENDALKATMNNIYANIKNLPAGHERFALDCIRKLLKPEEKS